MNLNTQNNKITHCFHIKNSQPIIPWFLVPLFKVSLKWTAFVSYYVELILGKLRMDPILKLWCNFSLVKYDHMNLGFIQDMLL